MRFPKRKQNRLKHYDYSQNGYYFVTVCTYRRRPIFADDVGAQFIAPERNASGSMNRTPTGRFIVSGTTSAIYGARTIAEQYLLDLKNRFKGLGIDFHVVMSEHIHVIFILDNCQTKLGEIIRTYKALVIHNVGARFIAPETNGSGSMNRTPTKIWQRGYYEHIIRNESALYKIREYIMNNPDKERYDWDELDVPKK